MKKLVTTLVVGLLAVSTAVATAGDRNDRSRDRRPQRLRLVSVGGPNLFGGRLAFLQVPPAPGPQLSAPPLTPIPEGTPLPDGSYVLPGPGPVGPMLEPGAFDLYPCVKYEDKDHIHPCAVTKIVAVKDPRPKCECDPSGCVYVPICVPEHICPKVKVEDGGREVTYDFGDYKVEIESKRGTVFVDYDD